jgi:hypothetical protein
MALMTEVCWRMKQVTSTVQRQAALLLGRLGRDEPHVWPGDCFTNRLGIPGIVLMALVHVGPRYQAHSVAKPPGTRAINDATRRRLRSQPGNASSGAE